MNSEYLLDKEQIRQLNEMYGGNVRNDAEIETALSMGRGRSVYRKIAYLWRAILVGHPFVDGNKRTALTVALTLLEKCHMEPPDSKKKVMVQSVSRIAKENIRDVDRIERMVRYAVNGN